MAKVEQALEKRLIDVGTLLTVGAFDLLRRLCLGALPFLAQAWFHPDATGPVPSGKDLD